MLRLTALIGTAATILTAAPGCTWQKAYSTARGWQRNFCYRLPTRPSANAA